MQTLVRGPVMADVAAFELTEVEKARLMRPEIGGVILFRRNFESVAQLKALVAEIKALRTPELVIAVDHEGGRVQRFIQGFTRLPAMAVLNGVWQTQGKEAALLRPRKSVGYWRLSCVRVALICRLPLCWIWIGTSVRSSAIAVSLPMRKR